MKQRSISAIGIVIVGLAPAIIGGPIFVLAIATIMLLAYRELLTLADITDPVGRVIGFATVGLAALLAWATPDGELLPAVLAFAVLAPLISIVFRQANDIDKRDWSSLIGAPLYLALPAFAAVSLRGTEGTVRANWFQSIADAMPWPGTTSAAGLGWLLLALFVTWLSDTAAYLIGRSVGRNKLIPHVSPNKTVEGAIGGLVAASVTAVLCVLLFGLAVHPLTAIVLGLVLGVVGILGDLSESMLKRRAGVKDSGDMIPGHGGMLDRVDALIFVLVATWAVQPLLT